MCDFNYCYLCLRENSELVTVCGKTGNDYSLGIKLKYVLPELILYTNYMDILLCRKCLDVLCTYFNFKKKCLDSNAELLFRIQQQRKRKRKKHSSHHAKNAKTSKISPTHEVKDTKVEIAIIKVEEDTSLSDEVPYTDSNIKLVKVLNDTPVLNIKSPSNISAMSYLKNSENNEEILEIDSPKSDDFILFISDDETNSESKDNENKCEKLGKEQSQINLEKIKNKTQKTVTNTQSKSIKMRQSNLRDFLKKPNTSQEITVPIKKLKKTQSSHNISLQIVPPNVSQNNSLISEHLQNKISMSQNDTSKNISLEKDCLKVIKNNILPERSTKVCPQNMLAQNSSFENDQLDLAPIVPKKEILSTKPSDDKISENLHTSQNRLSENVPTKEISIRRSTTDNLDISQNTFSQEVTTKQVSVKRSSDDKTIQKSDSSPNVFSQNVHTKDVNRNTRSSDDRTNKNSDSFQNELSQNVPMKEVSVSDDKTSQNSDTSQNGISQKIPGIELSSKKPKKEVLPIILSDDKIAENLHKSQNCLTENDPTKEISIRGSTTQNLDISQHISSQEVTTKQISVKRPSVDKSIQKSNCSQNVHTKDVNKNKRSSDDRTTQYSDSSQNELSQNEPMKEVSVSDDKTAQNSDTSQSGISQKVPEIELSSKKPSLERSTQNLDTSQNYLSQNIAFVRRSSCDSLSQKVPKKEISIRRLSDTTSQNSKKTVRCKNVYFNSQNDQMQEISSIMASGDKTFQSSELHCKNDLSQTIPLQNNQSYQTDPSQINLPQNIPVHVSASKHCVIPQNIPVRVSAPKYNVRRISQNSPKTSEVVHFEISLSQINCSQNSHSDATHSEINHSQNKPIKTVSDRKTSHVSTNKLRMDNAQIDKPIQSVVPQNYNVLNSYNSSPTSVHSQISRSEDIQIQSKTSSPSSKPVCPILPSQTSPPENNNAPITILNIFPNIQLGISLIDTIQKKNSSEIASQNNLSQNVPVQIPNFSAQKTSDNSQINHSGLGQSQIGLIDIAKQKISSETASQNSLLQNLPVQIPNFAAQKTFDNSQMNHCHLVQSQIDQSQKHPQENTHSVNLSIHDDNNYVQKSSKIGLTRSQLGQSNGLDQKFSTQDTHQNISTPNLLIEYQTKGFQKTPSQFSHSQIDPAQKYCTQEKHRNIHSPNLPNYDQNDSILKSSRISSNQFQVGHSQIDSVQKLPEQEIYQNISSSLLLIQDKNKVNGTSENSLTQSQFGPSRNIQAQKFSFEDKAHKNLQLPNVPIENNNNCDQDTAKKSLIRFLLSNFQSGSPKSPIEDRAIENILLQNLPVRIPKNFSQKTSPNSENNNHSLIDPLQENQNIHSSNLSIQAQNNSILETARYSPIQSEFKQTKNGPAQNKSSQKAKKIRARNSPIQDQKTYERSPNRSPLVFKENISQEKLLQNNLSLNRQTQNSLSQSQFEPYQNGPTQNFPPQQMNLNQNYSSTQNAQYIGIAQKFPAQNIRSSDVPIQTQNYSPTRENSLPQFDRYQTDSAQKSLQEIPQNIRSSGVPIQTQNYSPSQNIPPQFNHSQIGPTEKFPLQTQQHMQAQNYSIKNVQSQTGYSQISVSQKSSLQENLHQNTHSSKLPSYSQNFSRITNNPSELHMQVLTAQKKYYNDSHQNTSFQFSQSQYSHPQISPAHQNTRPSNLSNQINNSQFDNLSRQLHFNNWLHNQYRHPYSHVPQSNFMQNFSFRKAPPPYNSFHNRNMSSFQNVRQPYPFSGNLQNINMLSKMAAQIARIPQNIIQQRRPSQTSVSQMDPEFLKQQPNDTQNRNVPQLVPSQNSSKHNKTQQRRPSQPDYSQIDFELLKQQSNDSQNINVPQLIPSKIERTQPLQNSRNPNNITQQRYPSQTNYSQINPGLLKQQSNDIENRNVPQFIPSQIERTQPVHNSRNPNNITQHRRPSQPDFSQIDPEFLKQQSNDLKNKKVPQLVPSQIDRVQLSQNSKNSYNTSQQQTTYNLQNRDMAQKIPSQSSLSQVDSEITNKEANNLHTKKSYLENYLETVFPENQSSQKIQIQETQTNQNESQFHINSCKSNIAHQNLCSQNVPNFAQEGTKVTQPHVITSQNNDLCSSSEVFQNQPISCDETFQLLDQILISKTSQNQQIDQSKDSNKISTQNSQNKTTDLQNKQTDQFQKISNGDIFSDTLHSLNTTENKSTEVVENQQKNLFENVLNNEIFKNILNSLTAVQNKTTEHVKNQDINQSENISNKEISNQQTEVEKINTEEIFTEKLNSNTSENQITENVKDQEISLNENVKTEKIFTKNLSSLNTSKNKSTENVQIKSENIVTKNINSGNSTENDINQPQETYFRRLFTKNENCQNNLNIISSDDNTGNMSTIENMSISENIYPTQRNQEIKIELEDISDTESIGIQEKNELNIDLEDISDNEAVGIEERNEYELEDISDTEAMGIQENNEYEDISDTDSIEIQENNELSMTTNDFLNYQKIKDEIDSMKNIEEQKLNDNDDTIRIKIEVPSVFDETTQSLEDFVNSNNDSTEEPTNNVVENNVFTHLVENTLNLLSLTTKERETQNEYISLNFCRSEHLTHETELEAPELLFDNSEKQIDNKKPPLCNNTSNKKKRNILSLKKNVEATGGTNGGTEYLISKNDKNSNTNKNRSNISNAITLPTQKLNCINNDNENKNDAAITLNNKNNTQNIINGCTSTAKASKYNDFKSDDLSAIDTNNTPEKLNNKIISTRCSVIVNRILKDNDNNIIN